MSRFDLTLDPERVPRRLEVINGAGGRRRWSADEKAQMERDTGAQSRRGLQLGPADPPQND